MTLLLKTLKTTFFKEGIYAIVRLRNKCINPDSDNIEK